MQKRPTSRGVRAPTGVLIGAALAVVLAAPAPAVAQGGPARVVVAAVDERQIADTVPVIARLVGTRNAEVATRAAGVVSEVLFDVGDSVAAGRALIRLDDQLARIEEANAAAALAAAAASIEVAKARARLTQQALARAEGLRGSTAFSRSTFEDLEEQFAESQSEIARAEAQRGVAAAALARAQYVLQHSVIYAPFDGVVVERMAQPGEYIGLGDPIARLLDVASLEIEADMPVDLVAGVTPGNRVEATFDGGYTTEATVRTLLPVETTSTRTRVVRLSLRGEALAPDRAATGRSVTLRVPVSAPREAPTIPKDALVQSRGGWSVFVAEDGAAAQRSVRLGQSAGIRIEVISGLAIGDYVVVRGNERLRPGQAIAPVLADGTPLGEAAADASPEAPAPAEEDEEADPEPHAGTSAVPAGSAAAATPAALREATSRDNAASGG